MNKIGVIGLAVMGANLAQNLADNGFLTAVYNRSEDKTKELVKLYGEDKNLIPFYDVFEFIASLERPKKIILMVQAGSAVDMIIEQILPLLSPGDIIIDGGNSFFKDTIKREALLKEYQIHFVGSGISGGEEGARHGPSIMPGGSTEMWKEMEPILSKIAAKDFKGLPCVAHIGENGAGHFVKMVHNAIEYIDMQLIAEIYWIMKTGLKMNNEEMAQTFDEWNKGKLNSYLIEITAKILKTKDKSGGYVVDTILDTAGSKGTGKWASIETLELGAPAMSMAMAVFCRYISDKKIEREEVSKKYKKPNPSVSTSSTSPLKEREKSIEELEKTLYVTKIMAYAQGYEMMRMAENDYGWRLDFKEISRIWQGGCIIRAQFLEKLTNIFAESKDIPNIILSAYFKTEIENNIKAARKTVCEAIMNEIPIAEILSAISYFDNLKSANLPANMTQAQRDLFGAHTYQTELGGEPKHFNW